MKNRVVRDERRQRTRSGIDGDLQRDVAEDDVSGEPGKEREVMLLVEEAGLRGGVRVRHAAGLQHHAGGGEHE